MVGFLTNNVSYFPIIHHFSPLGNNRDWHSIAIVYIFINSISFLVFPFMTESKRKRLCACGCGRNVTRGTELRHQQGKGPSTLASSILAQNWTLIGGRRKRNLKSSRQSVNHQQIGRRAPIRDALSGLTGASSHDNIPVHDHSPEDDYPMDDAGSGVQVRHNTPTMPYSPPQIPHSPPHSNGDMAIDNVVSALSTSRRSQRVSERVNRIGRQRWGTNHVQFYERGDDDADNPAEEEFTEDDLVAGGEDNTYADEELWDDENDVMAIAEPGQEGISVWDILGESFLQEVSRIGMFSVECF
jgi:hypothetical protein